MMSKKNQKEIVKRLNKKSLVILVISIILFAIVSILVSTNNISWLDDTVYNLISKIIYILSRQ